MMDICSAEVSVREFLEPTLLAVAEREYLRLVANVLKWNDPSAFALADTPGDTGQRRMARVAWIEFAMFSKACLCQLPGGKAKRQRNVNLTLTRLERWAAGERRMLWEDMPRRKQSSNLPLHAVDAEKDKAKRQLAAIALTQNGIPGRALDRLTSLGT